MMSIFIWAKLGKCRNEGLLQEQLTKKYCTGCPVIGLCSTYAIVYKERGIWGGTNDADRKRIPNSVRDIMTKQFQDAGLLENRSTESLESLMHLVELLPEQLDPIDQLENVLDASLDAALLEDVSYSNLRSIA